MMELNMKYNLCMLLITLACACSGEAGPDPRDDAGAQAADMGRQDATDPADAGADDAGGSSDQGETSDAGESAWPLDEPGVHVLSVEFEGIPREVRIAVPTAETAGIVFLLHGSGQTAESFLAKRREFVSLAHEQGWLIVTPLATETDGKTRWNFDNNATGPRDDAFILSLLDHVASEPGSRYLASFSNGGRMTHNLLGQFPDRFDAGGIVASNLGTYDILGTDEDRIVPPATGPANVFMANGSQDPSVPFNGGMDENGTSPPVDDAIARWTAASECVGDGVREDFAGGYRLSWTECADDTEVVQVAYQSNAHAWPEAGDVPELDLDADLVAFFLRHP